MSRVTGGRKRRIHLASAPADLSAAVRVEGITVSEPVIHFAIGSSPAKLFLDGREITCACEFETAASELVEFANDLRGRPVRLVNLKGDAFEGHITCFEADPSKEFSVKVTGRPIFKDEKPEA